MATWNKGMQSYYIGIPKFENLYWHKSYEYFLVKVKTQKTLIGNFGKTIP